MNVEEKITRAKTRLMLTHPYFGLLASRLETAPSDEVEAFLSDGRRLQYNPDYFAAESVDTVAFALANSAMHHVLAHENRKMKRQEWLWQLATDYAINDLLVRNGFRLPERVHYEERFAGKYAEEIYAILKEEIKNEEYNDDESNEEGFNEQNRNRQKEAEPPKKEKSSDLPLPPQTMEPDLATVWEAAEKEARRRAEEMGQLPGGLERLFAQKTGRYDWRSELLEALRRFEKSDYTFARPNKKLIAQGLYLPATTSDRLVLSVAIDSSGSVDEALLGRFVAELESLTLGFADLEVDLLVCDAKIQGVYRFMGGERLDFPLKGGGGTDFRPVFDYIDTHLPQTALLLYFTDGRGRFPDRAPHYQVVWAMPEKVEVPFGRVVLLK
ncbi:vWA domain-containing protein [Hydrogenimonas sp.]